MISFFIGFIDGKKTNLTCYYWLGSSISTVDTSTSVHCCHGANLQYMTLLQNSIIFPDAKNESCMKTHLKYRKIQPIN